VIRQAACPSFATTEQRFRWYILNVRFRKAVLRQRPAWNEGMAAPGLLLSIFDKFIGKLTNK